MCNLLLRIITALLRYKNNEVGYLMMENDIKNFKLKVSKIY